MTPSPVQSQTPETQAPARPQSIIHSYGRNYAPIKHLIDLADKSKAVKIPTTTFQEAVKEKFQYLSTHEDPVWTELYRTAQLIDLFIQGKQRLRPHPITGMWTIRPYKNDAEEKRVINLMRFYEVALKAKWKLSRPRIQIAPRGGADDRQQLSAKAGMAVNDYYYDTFYTSDFSDRECGLGIRNGTYLTRFRYDDGLISATALREVIENRPVQIGEGYGFCGNCQTEGKAEMFTAVEDSPIPAYACPNCGQTSTKVEPPVQANGASVTGTREVTQGEIVCDQLPLQSCRWNLLFRPEQSSWFIHRERTNLASIWRLLGKLELKGAGDDRGLDVLDKLAFVGQAISGTSVGGDKKPEIYKQPVTVDEMCLGPDDLADIRLSREEDTVCGQRIPANVPLCEVFPEGVTVCGLNGMEVITGVFPGTHQKVLVSGFWHSNPNSGAGTGIGDMVEVQKRSNTVDSQGLSGLQAGSTPSLLYIKGTISEDEARYLGDAKTEIPVDVTLLPDGMKDLQKIVAPAFQPSAALGALLQYREGFLNNMFQLTSGVTEFSEGLPGMAGRNDTATGAKIEQATSQAMSTPTLEGKAETRRRGTEITLTLFRECMPLKRWLPVKSKFGRQEFKQFSGMDLKDNLQTSVVENSEMPRDVYQIREDLAGFYAQFGGIAQMLQAKQMFPKEVAELAKKWNVQLDDEGYDAITSICMERIDQMKQGLQMAQDPAQLLEAIQPPVSQFEQFLDIKYKWLQEWLDYDEAREALPILRQGVEQLIMLCFQYFTGQEAAKAGQMGVVQTAGAAPAAIGQKLMEGEQPQEDPNAQAAQQAQLQGAQKEQEQRGQLEAQALQQQHEQGEGEAQRAHEQQTQERELAMRQAELETQERIAKTKPKGAAS
jgi:hypothetical protein